MSKFSTGLSVIAMLAASCAIAAAEEQRYVAYSTTALSITGDIVLSDDAIIFGNGVRVGLSAAGTRPGADWQRMTTTDAPVQLFRLAADPGELLYGNTLCGGMGPATYLGVQRVADASGSAAMTLSLSVFAGAQAPRTVADTLCGTYNFGAE